MFITIFTPDLTGAQTIVAVLLYRLAENRRRRPQEGDPFFVRYASCFLAMQMGKTVLAELGCRMDALDHRRFHQARALIEEKGDLYFQQAVLELEQAMNALYGDAKRISLQQLSATFRRGDLIGLL